jgi:hypothetical protein
MLREKRDPVARDRDRVQGRICSDFDDQLTRQLAASEAKLSDWYADLKFCIDHIHLANDWEADFLLGLGGYSHPSERQRDKLALIHRKIRLSLTVGRRRAIR